MTLLQSQPPISAKREQRATLIGLSAIVWWSVNVGLVRGVSNAYGPIEGMALMYTIAAILLIIASGKPKFEKPSFLYLLCGGALFVGTELSFALSIGYASNNRQAIEVSMINYLWPTFTMIAAIVLNGRKANKLIFPGVMISALGVFWVLGEKNGVNIQEICGDIASNPLSYGLALSSAVLWTLYSTVTLRMAHGKNYVPFFFIIVALVLWGEFLLHGDSKLVLNTDGLIYLFGGATAIAGGYITWNTGLLHGNVTVMAGASYFIPVFSAVFAAFFLHTTLTTAFWNGAAMVCTGSILCWLATRSKAPNTSLPPHGDCVPS